MLPSQRRTDATQTAVEAELTEVDGRSLVFGFIARQKLPAGRQMTRGQSTLERLLVDRDPSPLGPNMSDQDCTRPTCGRSVRSVRCESVHMLGPGLDLEVVP